GTAIVPREVEKSPEKNSRTKSFDPYRDGFVSTKTFQRKVGGALGSSVLPPTAPASVGAMRSRPSTRPTLERSLALRGTATASQAWPMVVTWAVWKSLNNVLSLILTPLSPVDR